MSGCDSIAPRSDTSNAELARALGRVVREERAARNWSQEELASRSGLHVTYLSAVERGRRNPTLSVLRRLSEAFGLPLSILLSQAETTDGRG